MPLPCGSAAMHAPQPSFLDKLPAELVEHIARFLLDSLCPNCECIFKDFEDQPLRYCQKQIAGELGAWRLTSRALHAKISPLFAKRCFGIWDVRLSFEGLERLADIISTDYLRHSIQRLRLRERHKGVYCDDDDVPFPDEECINYQGSITAKIPKESAWDIAAVTRLLSSSLGKLPNLATVRLISLNPGRDFPIMLKAISNSNCSLKSLYSGAPGIPFNAVAAARIPDQLAQLSSLSKILLVLNNPKRDRRPELFRNISSLLSQTSSLQELRLHYYEDRPGLHALFSSFAPPQAHTLRTLSLSGMELKQDHFCNFLATSAKTLQRFHLEDSRVAEGHLVKILTAMKSMPRLSSVELNLVFQLDHLIEFPHTCVAKVHSNVKPQRKPADALDEEPLEEWHRVYKRRTFVLLELYPGETMDSKLESVIADLQVLP